MTILSVHKLEKNFGERCLFRDITFDVGDRDKVGLVGDNGCGKTTLFPEGSPAPARRPPEPGIGTGEIPLPLSP